MTPEAEFRAAILDPARPAPGGLTGPDGQPAGRRFDVYRNNVTVSLREGLAQAFPLLRQLLGAEFFDAMATVHLRAHPPASPLLWQIGEAMPAFLAGFPPVAHLPYLPDVARLELALRHSYHAADASPLPSEALAAIPPDRLMMARVTLAPALRLVRSAWPLHAIWKAQIHGGPPPAWQPEDVVVLRPGYDPLPHRLPPGGADFVAALAEARTVAGAMGAAGPGHPLAETLGLLIAGGAIIAIHDEARR
jgi:hypothetical protein